MVFSAPALETLARHRDRQAVTPKMKVGSQGQRPPGLGGKMQSSGKG
jgi:hypothetical protein